MAYADFVTAMMALFMVLWISAQDEGVLEATSQYFQNPFKGQPSLIPFRNAGRDSDQADRDRRGTRRDKSMSPPRRVQRQQLSTAAAEFYRLLRVDESLENRPIDIQVTSDGLRVTVFDRSSRPVFEGDTTEFSEWGKEVVQRLAWLIDRHRLRVVIDGHTRPIATPLRENYSAWELSADRANAARRALVHYAVEPGQIDRVTGYAETRPLDGEPPESESNQRLTFSLSLNTTARLAAETAEPATTASPDPASASPGAPAPSR